MRVVESFVRWLGIGLAGASAAMGGEPPAKAASAAQLGTTPGSGVDLRPVFDQIDLARRRQGDRGTCSVFTMVGALEFAVAKQQRQSPRLSVEFLNWAANQACGDKQDGGFFSDLWKGFSAYGICAEAEMPYEAKFNSGLGPSERALTEAKTRQALGLQLHWIKEWNVNTGLADREFKAIQGTLAHGWPVCGGLRWPKRELWIEGVLQMCGAEAVRDGHSVLLVGYRDDLMQPGGGVFIFRNTSNDGQDGFMPYAYARLYMNDAAWVESATNH